ncbi:MAG: hypothetical protein GY839_19405 [candidate division Zixibacteria bacterium]|nr:hypothetical protein [candidate division Zixibacteria bacterium]
MIIRLDNKPYYLAEIDQIYTAWWPVNFNIGTFSINYLRKKLGQINPQILEDIQTDYAKYLNSDYNKEEDDYEHYCLSMGNVDYRFHLIDQIGSQVCVYMEKELYTLGDFRPEGYACAHISAYDSPEEVQIKLFDHRYSFGVAMKMLLDRICDW